MAQGVANSCVVCDSPNSFELDCRILRGDTWDDVATRAGVTPMTIKRHLDAGHIKLDPTHLREWMQKNHRPIGKQLERARTQALAKPDEKVTVDMVNATLLSLAQHGMRLLNKMEESEDYRGSVQAIESLRRTAMDLATMNNLRGHEQKEATESVDVSALRQSILDQIQRPKGVLINEPYGYKK